MKFGLIATPLAYLNMQKKRRNYEEALKKSELLAETRAALQKQINAYEIQKSILDDIHLGVPQDGAEKATPLKGLQAAYTLQVGKLGGKNMSAQIILKIKNGSDKTMRLTAFQFKDLETIDRSVNIKFVDYNPCYVTNSIEKPIELKSGEGCELEVGAFEAAPLLSKDNLKTFRDWLASWAGKKLYTNIPKGYVYQKKIICRTFGTYYVYQLGTGEWVTSQALLHDVVGNIEYMGITWMPIDLGLGKIILKAVLGLFTFGVSDIIWNLVEDSKNQNGY